MANTKRFTINQHWQQISKGNVTLTGCNTVATYHIFVGADTPTGDSDYISDTLAESTPYNFDTPVWVKLNVTNQVDEADMIAIGELAEQALANDSKSKEALIFQSLENCEYKNEVLNYTSGVLSETSEVGYIAITDKVYDLEIKDSQVYSIAIGENLSPNNEYINGIWLVKGQGYIRARTGANITRQDVLIEVGDILNLIVKGNVITLINKTRNVTYNFESEVDITANANMLVMTSSTDSLAVKAI